MPERKLVAPPPGLDVDPQYMQDVSGHYGLTDYVVHVYEKPSAAKDAPMVLFKGGWGDADAVSCIPLAMQAADLFGRAATVSNRRLPWWNPMNLVAIPRARTARSEAVHAGLVVAHAMNVPHAVVAGQSFGGNNAVDATLHAVETMPADERPEKLSVMTIDSPGVYGDLERSFGIISGLVGLTKSIMQDFRDNPEIGGWLTSRLVDTARRRSPLETLYFGSEMLSLLHIDISGQVRQLREEKKVPVLHVFHDADVVPRIEDASAAVFEGGHGAALVRPAEIVNHMASTALREFADPIAA